MDVRHHLVLEAKPWRPSDVDGEARDSQFTKVAYLLLANITLSAEGVRVEDTSISDVLYAFRYDSGTLSEPSNKLRHYYFGWVGAFGPLQLGCESFYMLVQGASILWLVISRHYGYPLEDKVRSSLLIDTPSVHWIRSWIQCLDPIIHKNLLFLPHQLDELCLPDETFFQYPCDGVFILEGVYYQAVHLGNSITEVVLPRCIAPRNLNFFGSMCLFMDVSDDKSVSGTPSSSGTAIVVPDVSTVLPTFNTFICLYSCYHVKEI